jgi:hypothetical protein
LRRQTCVAPTAVTVQTNVQPFRTHKILARFVADEWSEEPSCKAR